jgi:hypothetical protein
MTRRDFYSLSRPVQERLLDSFHARYAPLPILVKHGPRRTAVTWLAVSVAGAVVAILLWTVGFGNASTFLSLHPAPFALLFALALASTLTGVICAVAHAVQSQSLPFPPGIYLFPASLIDARDERLEVHNLSELTQVSAAGSSVALRIGNAGFLLPVSDSGLTAEAVSRIQTAAQQLAQADDKQIFELDPLTEPSVLSPLAPQQPLASNRPLWIRLRFAIGGALGLLLGIGMFSLRNDMSDQRMFARARSLDSVEAYTTYLARGRAHRDVVEHELLPRAKLRLAIAEGGVDVIDAFTQEHPADKIQHEVDIARRNALIAEFEQVRKVGTLEALLSYAARRPKHGMGKPFEQALHAPYALELQRYKQRAPEDSELPEVVQQLISYSEKSGAKKVGDKFLGSDVKVHFLRLKSQTIHRADQAVSKNPMFNGVSSLPTRYFSDEKLSVHTKASAAALAKSLSAGFNGEILRFTAGESWVGDEESVAPAKAPRILVHYRVEWSGGAHASKKPRGVFIGLYVFFRARIEMPGAEPVILSKYTAGQNVPLEKLAEFSGADAAGTAETAIYAGMLHTAFAEFQQEHLAKWFKAGAGK